jgi:ADP-heptose:LPS heptosyltransferase
VEGRAWAIQHPIEKAAKKTVVLNIGCGTPDALVKRPDLANLAACCVELFGLVPFKLHLSGAAFEKDVNAEFAALFALQMVAAGNGPEALEVVDWSGHLSLDMLSGLLQQADLAISSDSGPYHMAVALGIPTLCWFNFDTPPSYHRHGDVACMVLPTPQQFAQTAQRLLRRNSA